MSVSIRLRSPASPERVLTAVREHAGEWRESAIPQNLREQGLRRVQVKIKGSRFTLSMPTLSDVPDDIVLRCHVSPDGSTGSRVEGWYGPRWKVGNAAAVLAIPGLAFFFFGDRTLGLILLGMAGLGAVGDTLTERKVDRRESEIAQYLISRVRDVLATLGPAPKHDVASDVRPGIAPEQTRA
jgi:hypothetical protein